MKKKLFGGMAILAIAAIAAFNVKISNVETDSYSFSLSRLEAHAQNGGESGNTKYNKKKGNCTKTFTADANGYASVLGRRIKLGSVSGDYEVTYTDVQIDCPDGTQYSSCTECSCSNFWQQKC